MLSFNNMSDNKVQPDYLKSGDEVAIISPSFLIEEKWIINAVRFLEKWGLRVRVGKNALKQNGPFAGSDEERLSDLQEMTDDCDIKAVFCARGGYGISRIISKVDFSALKNNPKWYVGFSDVTVLQMWLVEVCGIMSVHGDMPLNYNNPEKTRISFKSLKQALFGNLQPCEWRGTFFRTANITGEVTGGNLSLLYSLTGTSAEPATKGKIFFIEEVGGYYYQIDRMLTSMKLAGKLEGLAALVVGGMNKIEEANIPWGRSIEETISGIVSDYNYPLLFNFPAGHIPDNRAFYIGRQASINVKGNKATLTFV
jgi:muramoyltetrapeptide carboxypeptidase